MKKISRVFSKLTGTLVIIYLLSILTTGCQKERETNTPMNEGVAGKDPQALKDFVQKNLVANNDEYGIDVRVEPKLVNGWGITFSPGGVAWISAEVTGVSIVANQDGGQVLAPVDIPSPGGPSGGHPSGTVFNGTTDFALSNAQPARFLFVGTDGVISGWNGGTAAELIKNNSATSAYTGLAINNSGGNNFIYAADFRAGRIDVYNGSFTQVMTMPFVDPNIPAGFAPFNIQSVGSKLYVTYAKVGDDGDEEKGPHLGFVSIFSTNGTFERRFVSEGQLNAPWGIAKAPIGFWGEGEHNSDVILVGNFGDGHINAYNADGAFLGQLRAHGNPIVIDGLWGIGFAPAGKINRLFFAAGPDDEEDGLFGYISKEKE